MAASKGNKSIPKKGKNKGGRPRIELIEKRVLPEKEILFDQVLYWIDLQATAEEIAGSFYVSVDTLDARLKEHYGYGFSELKKDVLVPLKCHFEDINSNKLKKMQLCQFGLVKSGLANLTKTK